VSLSLIERDVTEISPKIRLQLDLRRTAISQFENYVSMSFKLDRSQALSSKSDQSDAKSFSNLSHMSEQILVVTGLQIRGVVLFCFCLC